MKTLLRKWRGLQIAAAMAVAVMPLHGVQVKTLGGGPNQSGVSRYGSVNGNTLLNAKFFNPYGLAQDDNGNLFVADRSNNKVRKITKPGAADSLTSTFKSGLLSPVGVAVDGSNNVYVLTQGDGKLRKYSNTGLLLKTVSRLVSPTALAVSTNYTVYVVELGGSLKMISPAGVVSLLGPGGFNQPRGIAIMQDGRLAITTSRNHAVYTVNPTNGVATLLAGANGAGYNDGPGALAQFNGPYGIATAPNGSLVVADRNNNRVRMVATDSTVSTLFGVAQSQWAVSFPGWSDGDSSVAASRSPVGVAVGRDGTVYDTEVYWHLIRQATGVALGSTNNTGVSTNTVGTNTFVGTNIISFGFPSGEGSSEFIGAAGQKFYAPVTLSIAIGQKIYSFQMSLSATTETAVALNPFEAGFVSMLAKPIPGVPNAYTPIDPNYTFLNSGLNLMGIGWIERFQATNLYDTVAQDLIAYSIAKDTLFKEGEGQIILGAYRIPIPSVATTADAFRIAIRNPSGTADGVSQPVIPLRVPVDGSLGAGAMNTVKRITVGSRPYLVGDSAPFRWFNAGDFGDNILANNDIIEVFQTAVYGLNFKPTLFDSDLFNAMDSSDGFRDFHTFDSHCPPGDPLCDGDDVTINSITMGDGILNVDDVWVTFRRSLDPTLKWFARYWSNGALQVVEVPNTLMTAFDAKPKAAVAKRSVGDAPAVRPSATLSVSDSMPAPGAVLQFPVHISLSGGYPAKVMMLGVSVEALDGSPAITTPIQFQTAPGLNPQPELSNSRGPNNYAAAWLDKSVVGYSGEATLAILTVAVPANAGPSAAYRIHFDHFSASPNGIALFDVRAPSALILLSDRSASSWSDGVSDAWRLRYFGSIFSSDSALSGDPDGDGVINSIEYQNGTDPTDVTSH